MITMFSRVKTYLIRSIVKFPKSVEYKVTWCRPQREEIQWTFQWFESLSRFIIQVNLFLSVSRYVACSMPFYQLYLLREDLVCILRSHTKEPSIPLLALLILHLRYNTPFALAYLTTRMMHLVVSTIAYIVEKVNDGCIPMSFIFSRQLCYVRVQKIHIRYIKCKSKKDFVDHVQAIMQLPLQNKSSWSTELWGWLLPSMMFWQMYVYIWRLGQFLNR